MQFRTILALVFALILSSCISGNFRQPPDDYNEWVSFDTTSLGPFCGRCDTTYLIVAYDGRVRIEQGQWAIEKYEWAGDNDEWLVNRRQLRVSEEALARFLERLAPYRPNGVLSLTSESRQCKSVTTDQGVLTIVWHDKDGDAKLVYDLGCDWELRRDMAKALWTAPALLEIKNLPVP